MRGWGRPPICKASRPDHGLGIRATHNLVEEGKKGRRGGQRKTCEECRDERETELSGSRKNCEKSVF
jgi:hypothetical protein